MERAITIQPRDSITRHFENDDTSYQRRATGYVVNGKFWPNEAVTNREFAEELCDKQHRERHAPMPEAANVGLSQEKLSTFEFYFTSGRELTKSEHNRLHGMNIKKFPKDETTNDHVYGIDMQSVWDLGRLVKVTGHSVVMNQNLRLEIIDDYRE